MVKRRNELWMLLFTGVVIHMLTMSNLNMAITAMIKQKISNDTTTISQCAVDLSWHLTTSEQGPSPQETGEFDWSNADRDMLLGSASWLMGVGSLLGGILCQRVGGKIMFGYANLIAGIFNIITPTAATFGVMWVVMIRVIQGFVGGAGVAISINYFMSNWVPHNERSKFAATLAGLYFGVGFSNFLNGLILYLYGWRYVFYVSGIVSILWVLVWYGYVYNHPEKHPRVTSGELSKIRSSVGDNGSEKSLPIPWIRILTSIPIIVNSLCYFANMWTTFTFMTYIPTYLRTVHGLSYDKLGSYSSLPYVLEFLVAISFATLMDFIVKREHLTVTNTRKFAAFTNHIIGGILWGSIVLGGCNTTFVLIMITIAVTINGTSVAIYTPNIIDLSPNFSAAIHGVQGLIGSVSGFLSPMVVNYYTTNYNGVDAWNGIFVVSAALNIVSGSLFLIFGLSTIQNWNAQPKVDVELKDTLGNENR